MDVIIFGVYNNEDKDELNTLISQSGEIEIVWEYEEFNIESQVGIELLENTFNLFDTGVLVLKEEITTFSSYPLIYEVTESILENRGDPKLFGLFDKLQESKIPKMLIAFADEWNRSTLVRFEKNTFGSLKQRLNNIFVWCESYLNLENNSEIRGDDHPLILMVDKFIVEKVS